MVSSVGMSMGAGGVRAVRTTDGESFSVEWFPSIGPGPDAEDVAHAIRAMVDRADAPNSLGVAFPDPDYSAALRSALVEEYVSDVHIISEIAGAIEQLRSDPNFHYRTVALYDLGATGLELTVADIESGTIYATTRSLDLSGSAIDEIVRSFLLTLDILAMPRNEEENSGLLAFSREIKEALSTHTATQTSDAQFQLMDRRMFDLQIIRPAERSAIALLDLAERSEIPPEVVVAIGGGARIPLIRDVLGRYLRIPVVVPDAPELIAARGAALYATRVDGTRPARPSTARRSAQTFMTPLLRFGLPSIVALGLLSWAVWPDGNSESVVTGTSVSTLEDAETTSTTFTSLRPSVTATTTTRPTTPTAAAITTTYSPAPAPETSAPYIPRRNTVDDATTSPAAPRPAPAPAPFQLPRLELPEIRLSPLLPFP